MPSVAEVWLTMRTDRRKIKEDIEAGAASADTKKAGERSGSLFARAFGAAVKKETSSKRTALAEFTKTISGFGDITQAASKDASLFARGVAAVGAATGIAEPALAAVLVNAGALAGAFAAAGAGAAAYAAALYPALASTGVAMKATSTHTAQVAKIQANYNAALAGGAKPAAAAAARARALSASNAQLAASMKGIPPQVRQFAVAVTAAKDAYMAWGKALAGPVLAPLTLALSNVRPLLRQATPLVKVFSGALKVLVTELSSNISAGGFQRVVQTLLPYVVPNVLNLAHAIGNVVAGLWDVIKVFLPFSTQVTGNLANLTGKFKDWASTLQSHNGFTELIKLWRDSWPQVRKGLEQFLGILINVVKAWSTMLTPASSGLMWDLANPMLALANSLSAHPELVQALTYLYLVSRGAKELGGVFGGLKSAATAGGKLLSLISGGKIQLGMQGAGDTMLVASRAMQVAADTMAAAAGVPKAGLAGGAAKVKAGGLAGIAGTVAGLLGTAAITAAVIGLAGRAIAGLVPKATARQQQNYQQSTPGLVQGVFGAVFGSKSGAGSVISWLQQKLGTGPGGQQNIFQAAATAQATLQRAFSKSSKWLQGAGNNVIFGLWSGISDRWKGVQNWFGGTEARIGGYLTGAASWLVGHGRQVIGGLWSGVSSRWSGVASWFSGMPGRVQGWFRGALSWLTSAGRNVISGLWGGISGRWAGVAGWFSGMASRIGEFWRGCLQWLVNAGSNVITGLWNGMQSVWHKVTGWISGLAKWIKDNKGPLALDQRLLQPAGQAIMQGLKVGLLGGMMPIKSMLGAFTGDISSLLGKLPGLVSKLGGALGIGGGSVGRWAGVAALALRLAGAPAGLLHNVLVQMQSESGGNPLAVNLTDINAQMGDPSKGLMQVIGATFRAFAGPLFSRGIFDPLANIYAAIKYAQAVYGPSLMANGMGIGSGHGYAHGTPGAAPGWAWVGERGRELVRFWGGETVLPHGASMRGARPGYAQGTGPDPLAARLDRIAALLEHLAADTGAAFADVLNGLGRNAVRRQSYGVGYG